MNNILSYSVHAEKRLNEKQQKEANHRKQHQYSLPCAELQTIAKMSQTQMGDTRSLLKEEPNPPKVLQVSHITKKLLFAEEDCCGDHNKGFKSEHLPVEGLNDMVQGEVSQKEVVERQSIARTLPCAADNSHC